MLKKFASALVIMFTIMLAVMLLPYEVFAAGNEITAAAFASSGYDGDEKNTFAPMDSYNVASFPIKEDSWNLSGLSSRSGVNTKNNITYVYSIVDRLNAEDGDKNYTEFNLDLSSFRCNMSDYSTFCFGIAIYGANDRQYTVTASLYSGNDRVVGEALTGVGWNLFCIDVSNASGIASHIKITIHYDGEIPLNIRISSPYATKTINRGFEISKKYLTYKLNDIEGKILQESGRIRPTEERAVIEGNFFDVKNQINTEAGSTVYFELKLSGVQSGNFTLGLKCDDSSEMIYSKKISLSSGGEDVVVIPMTLSGRLSSFSLVFDNIKCDVTFTLEYIKIHKIDSAPAAAVSGIGSLSKITRTSDSVVFSGSMERTAVSEYSSSGDGMIHFYALHSSDMGDISKATELGSIKLTTVFEYTVKLSGFPSVGESHMFFAATADRDGNIFPLSRPRFPDADMTPDISSYSGSYGVNLGLFDPATVGAFESNVSSVIIDIPLDEFLLQSDYQNLSSKSVSFPYAVYDGDEAQNRTLEVDREKLSELDSDIAFYTSTGIKVYLRLHARRAIDNLTYSELEDCESYAFRADSEESRAMFAAIVRFFAKRYPGIKGFELGLAANVYSCIGERIPSVSDYVSYLSELCRICYNAASTADASANSSSSADSSALDGMCIILPFMDTTGMTADEYIPIETIALMLTGRLNEIGQIPLVFLYSFEDDSSSPRITDAVRLMNELEFGNFSGIMYFYKPNIGLLAEKYSKYTSEALLDGMSQSDIVPYTEFAAQSFGSLAEKLNDDRTVGVYFSMENTNLKNSHDFYSVLKHAGEGIGYVCDTAAVPIAPTVDSAKIEKNAADTYVLFDFSDKYHTDGWIAGGGVELCETDWSSVFTAASENVESDGSGNTGTERVLTVQFKQDDYYSSKSSGAAGIALYNFPKSIDMTKVDTAVFTIALDGESDIAKSSEYAETTVVFVIGTDDTRAEYYAEKLECGKTYSFGCPLGEYENRGGVDYIGIMVYSDIELRLELSSVSLLSDELGAEGIGELFEERETPLTANYKVIALFSFTVAAFSIMVFIFLARLEREEEENDLKNNRANGYSTSNGGANEHKYRRQ